MLEGKWNGEAKKKGQRIFFSAAVNTHRFCGHWNRIYELYIGEWFFASPIRGPADMSYIISEFVTNVCYWNIFHSNRNWNGIFSSRKRSQIFINLGILLFVWRDTFYRFVNSHCICIFGNSYNVAIFVHSTEKSFCKIKKFNARNYSSQKLDLYMEETWTKSWSHLHAIFSHLEKI